MKKILLLFASWYVFFVLRQQLIPLFKFNLPNKNLNNLILLIPSIIISIILLILYKNKIIKDFREYDKEDLFITLKYWAVSLVLMYITNSIISFFIPVLPQNELSNREIVASLPIFSLFAMSIFNPFCEEICFRLSFNKIFNNKYVYVIITSIIFGAVHISSFELKEFIFIIPYMTMGVVMALGFYKTKNIFTSIFMHMIHNLTMLVLIFISSGVL